MHELDNKNPVLCVLLIHLILEKNYQLGLFHTTCAKPVKEYLVTASRVICRFVALLRPRYCGALLVAPRRGGWEGRGKQREKGFNVSCAHGSTMFETFHILEYISCLNPTLSLCLKSLQQCCASTLSPKRRVLSGHYGDIQLFCRERNLLANEIEL